jgi:hypothetical protein
MPSMDTNRSLEAAVIRISAECRASVMSRILAMLKGDLSGGLGPPEMAAWVLWDRFATEYTRLASAAAMAEDDLARLALATL